MFDYVVFIGILQSFNWSPDMRIATTLPSVESQMEWIWFGYSHVVMLSFLHLEDAFSPIPGQGVYILTGIPRGNRYEETTRLHSSTVAVIDPEGRGGRPIEVLFIHKDRFKGFRLLMTFHKVGDGPCLKTYSIAKDSWSNCFAPYFTCHL